MTDGQLYEEQLFAPSSVKITRTLGATVILIVGIGSGVQGVSAPVPALFLVVGFVGLLWGVATILIASRAMIEVTRESIVVNRNLAFPLAMITSVEKLGRRELKGRLPMGFLTARRSIGLFAYSPRWFSEAIQIDLNEAGRIKLKRIIVGTRHADQLVDVLGAARSNTKR